MKMSSLTIAYHPACKGGLSFRGTEVAMYGYAHHAETLLGHKSIICLKQGALNEPLVLEQYVKRFPIIYFKDTPDLELQLIALKVDAFYTIRYGNIEEPMLHIIPMIVHCVYYTGTPHGLVSAGISGSVVEGFSAYVSPDLVSSISKVSKLFSTETPKVSPSHSGMQFVPHMVYIEETSQDYRSDLGIPADAVVLGRHGGDDTWDLIMAAEAVIKVLENNPNIWFLFAIRPEILYGVGHPRLICLEVFADLHIKRKFINTCDYYLHAQSLGETFGLSLAEMSMANKPIIVWNGGRCQEHLRILGDKCIKYSSADELYNIIIKLDPKKTQSGDWKAYSEYSPEIVMEKFDRVFLDAVRAHKLTQKSVLHPSNIAP